MDASRLFLERCSQIRRLLESSKEIDVLDLSAPLRQLLIDDHPLVHKANESHRIKLRFRVNQFHSMPDKFTTVLALEDGLDPDTARPGKASTEVSLDGFLGHTVLWFNGKPRSVYDIIDLAANVAGGVHHSKPKESQRLIAEYSSLFGIGGLPAGCRQLKAIARVTLKGLAPLIDAVQKSS